MVCSKFRNRKPSALAMCVKYEKTSVEKRYLQFVLLGDFVCGVYKIWPGVMEDFLFFNCI